MTQYGVLIKPFISINGVDLSSRVRSENLGQQIEGQDDTEGGDLTRTEAPGLIVNSFDVEFNQDFAASGAGAVDATLSAMVQGRLTGAFEFRHDTAVVGVTNPKWTSTVFIKDYKPSGGKIGDMSVATATIGFTAPLVRAVA